jgi:signal-transduction protein with cAMP-binding, CBS, and nucleotidyltransferase domain
MVWEQIDLVFSGERYTPGMEGVLRRRDGSLLECVVTVNPIDIDSSNGVIILAKEVTPAISTADEKVQKEELSGIGWSAPVGLFQARSSRRGVFIKVNPYLQQILADFRIEPAQQPALADFFPDQAEFQLFLDELQKEGFAEEKNLQVETIEAGTRNLSLSARMVSDETGRTRWIEGAIHDVTGTARREAEREALIEKLQASLLFLQEPVGRLGKNLVRIAVQTSIQKAAVLMTAHGASAAVVEMDDGTPIGMVTDHDLRERVLTEGLDLQAPVRVVMSAPLVTISEKSMIFEALMRMEEKGIQYLAVEDEQGKIINILRYKEMVQFHRYGSLVLTNEISRAATVEAVIRSCQRSPALVSALVNVGAQPQNITRMVSLTCDAAVEKFIQFAVAELGAPPVPFTFLAMGSQGRQEQTLLTDQDNAIVYLDPAVHMERRYIEDYFLRLGEKVVRWLDQAGYPLCQGNMMANNQRWCRPLSDWKRYFDEWILKAEPQELLDFSIFFDFRPIYGSLELSNDLRRFIHQSVNEYPPFFIHFAKNALLFTPPTRLFGRIFLGGGSMEHEGNVNLKDAMMSIGNFARLYALRHRVNAVNTLERIDALLDQKVLLPSSRDDIVAAYNFFMRLRLHHQVDLISSGKLPDNLVPISKLSHHDAAQLQQAYGQITAVQKKISYDFLGGT